MKKLLKVLLTYKFRTQKLTKKGGFTLIELLVGLILAFLVITPLLGFMISVMTSDRQEQAKSASEQEIQTALDYISRDLSQSIFIYDGFGLQTIASQLPAVPAGKEGAPVLVFWKREFISKDKLRSGTKDDAYVLSLVAYYLIKDNPCSSTSTWSCTARIERVQLKDAVPDPDSTEDNPLSNIQEASPGFKPFGYTDPPTPTGRDAKMNAWKSDLGINNNQFETLIDYVDQTLVAATSPPGPTITPCSTEGRTDTDRPDVTLGATDDGLSIPYTHRQVPAVSPTGSFYACVNTDKTLAQVFIRGNSVARTKPKANPPTYSASQSAYFPKANIQVQGRGQITTTPEG